MHSCVFDEDGDCIACGTDALTPAHVVVTMTARQRTAWERDIPVGCPCDYIWTGMVWTRSGAAGLCELHGHEVQP
jgi:hypothetical protein